MMAQDALTQDGSDMIDDLADLKVIDIHNTPDTMGAPPP